MSTTEKYTSGSGRVDSARKFDPAKLQKMQDLVKQLQVSDLRIKKDIEAKAKVFKKCKNRINFLEYTIEEKNKRIDELERLNKSMLLLNESNDEKEERLKGLEEELKELSLVEISVAEFSSKVELLESKIRECNEGFGLFKKSMEDFGCAVELRENDLDSRERGIQEGRENLDVLELRVLEREKGLDILSGRLEKREKEVVQREKNLDSVSHELQRRERELEQKEKDIEAKAKVFEKCKNRIVSLEFTIEENKRELAARNNRIEELEKSNRSMLLLNELIDDKEERLKGLEEEMKSKMEELSLIENKIKELGNGCSRYEMREKEVELKMKKVCFTEKRVNDYLGDERREREVVHKAKEIELNQKRFNSEMKTLHLEPFGADANVGLSTSDQSWINMDGRSLQLAMNKYVEGFELMNRRISAALRASPDPAKLVLDAMQGFYPLNVTVDNGELQLDLRVVRKSCILLLKKLKGMSTLINPQVREEAMRLAVDWKAQMAVDTANSIKALGFLRLITTYEISGFAGMFDSRELRELVYKVAEPALAIEIDRALGLTIETPVTNIMSSNVDTEQPRSSLARNAATRSTPNDSVMNEGPQGKRKRNKLL